MGGQPAAAGRRAVMTTAQNDELPTVARLYYSGVGARRYKRASTRSGPGEPLCFVSVATQAMRRRDARIFALESECERLRAMGGKP